MGLMIPVELQEMPLEFKEGKDLKELFKKAKTSVSLTFFGFFDLVFQSAIHQIPLILFLNEGNPSNSDLLKHTLEAFSPLVKSESFLSFSLFMKI
jgi:hypothetical protein